MQVNDSEKLILKPYNEFISNGINEDNAKWLMAPLGNTSGMNEDNVQWLMAPSGNTSGGGGGDGSDSGCRIDKIFDTWLKQRILESGDLIDNVKTLYQWNITKKGKIASIWSKLNTNGI